MAKKEDNLIPQAHTLTVDEQSAGGIASGKARREKKTMQELAEKLLNCAIKDDKLLRQLKQFGFSSKDGKMSVKEAMICAMSIQAIKGNPRAYEVIKETLEPKNSLIANDIEDMKPLSELLKIDGNTDTDN